MCIASREGGTGRGPVSKKGEGDTSRMMKVAITNGYIPLEKRSKDNISPSEKEKKKN